MNKKTSISRRQFLKISSLGGAGILLAACSPTATEQTATPNPATSPPATETGAEGAAGNEVTVIVSDVLDFALETDEWTGQYGWVRFQLQEGRYNGEPIYFIRTDASNPDFADEVGLVHVPLLNAGGNVAHDLYRFNNGRFPILSTSPSDEENYIPLFRVKNVTVSDDSLTLDSAAAVEAAAENGGVTIEDTSVLVNYPVVKWNGGELPADTELTETLGQGPLTEPVNTDEMTVTFKLHQCFPGSRYIITDTSAAPMAPMMSIVASPPSQALMDAGGTDEIWVFANGVSGSGVMGFQPAIFDNKAGEPTWSPYWNHFTLSWVDESNARVLRSSQEIRELLDAGELEQFNGVPDSHPNGFVVNCPAPILAPNTF